MSRYRLPFGLILLSCFLSVAVWQSPWVSFVFAAPAIAALEDEKDSEASEDKEQKRDENEKEPQDKSQKENEQQEKASAKSKEASEQKKSADRKEQSEEKEPATIAVFTLRGMLPETPMSDDLLFGSAKNESLKDLLERLDKAREDDKVKAVVLLLEDASIGFAQSQELRSAMKELQDAGKKVYAHADTLQMGDYLLLSGCSELSVVPTGDIWITGLYGQSVHFRGLLDMIGVVPDFYTCGEYKSAAEMFTRKQPSEQAAENVDWLLDGLFESLVTSIAEGRGVEEKQVRQWIDEGIFTAEEAKEAGIIDAVRFRHEFEAALKETYGDKLTFDKKYGRTQAPSVDFSSPFGIFKFYADLLSGPQKKKSSKDAVAIVYVEGPILPGRPAPGGFPLSSGAMAYSTPIREALDECLRDESVKAVVLRVNSPGGSAVASEIILQATQRVKEKKPLIVSMGDIAGSGGYYVACGTDTIFADATTVTGSIGVVAGKLATEDMWNKIGVNWEGFKRGKNAGILASGDKFSESEREQLLEFMNDIYATFKDHVKAARGDRLEKDLEDLAGGRVYTGKQAMELGLVDELGGLQAAIEHAAKEADVDEYEVRVLPAPKSFIELLFADAGKDDDKDGKHLSLALGGLWAPRGTSPLVDAALPYLRELEPVRFRAVTHALYQLELLQQERVIMAMPEIVFGN